MKVRRCGVTWAKALTPANPRVLNVGFTVYWQSNLERVTWLWAPVRGDALNPSDSQGLNQMTQAKEHHSSWCASREARSSLWRSKPASCSAPGSVKPAGLWCLGMWVAPLSPHQRSLWAVNIAKRVCKEDADYPGMTVWSLWGVIVLSGVWENIWDHSSLTSA